MSRPLEGIHVLDVGTLTPGKFCTTLLADMGATVLRVERPTGNPPPLSDEDLVLNRNKRSMTLNLREEAGREVFYRLARKNAVVEESHPPGAPARGGGGGGRPQ